MCIAQPSQDNRDDMVKKLEAGTTEVKLKEQNKKINTSTKSLNHASIQGNIRSNDQVTLHTKKNKKCSECFEEGHLIWSCPYIKENGLVINKEDRKCFRCSEKGHMVKSCPYVKQKGIVLENKHLLTISKQETRKEEIFKT
jgi:hypothetical protein